MNGSGAQTFNQGSATLHDVGVKTLNGWTFNNEKPLTMSGGNIRLASNAGIAATGATAASHNLTINATGNNTALILESSTDVSNVTVPFANPGNQSLDLNAPATPGSFNAIRVYAADLTAAK